jgi:hypothetical protein
MIDVIFTIDYEIYGNGEGSLRELVYEPAGKLMSIFKKWNASFVLFVEVAELEKIGECHSDKAIDDVRRQVREFYGQGIEIGLHLHPQWYNALYENEQWLLDYSEYNLCMLPRERIEQIVRRSISYLRELLGVTDFTPLSFRAGNWLLQPSQILAAVLAEAGIKIDSSVFKGGLQRNLKLDYRPALRNGYYWRFQDDVNKPDPRGKLIEVPTHTKMVPCWKMVTAKRVDVQKKSSRSPLNSNRQLNRLLDYLRFFYPLKFDFCRATADELLFILEKVRREDREYPELYRPIVAIGHTKDFTDDRNLDSFLSSLSEKGIAVATFRDVYAKVLAYS